MLGERLPERPGVGEELHAFHLNKTLSASVHAVQTPMGNQPVARFSQDAERPDGRKVSQRFDLDCRKLVEIGDRVAFHLAEWPERQGLFDRLGEKFARALHREMGPKHIVAFDTERVRVEVAARKTKEGLKPYARLSHREMGPDGREQPRSFVIDARHLATAANEVRTVVQVVDRQEEVKRQGQKERWWAVCNVKETLETGAVLEVIKTYKQRVDAELRCVKGSSYIVFPLGLEREYKPGERLVVSSGVSRAVDARIDEFKSNTATYERFNVPNLKTARITPGLRPEARVVGSVTHGEMRADYIRFTGEDGLNHARVLVTRPVKQEDGTTKEVTREYTRQEFRAMLRGEKHRPASEATQRPAEAAAPKPAPASEKQRAAALTWPHAVVGVWCGVEPPKMGQPVKWRAVVRWSKTDQGWTPQVRGVLVMPTEGTVAAPKPEDRRYLLAGRGPGDDEYRALDSSRDRGKCLSKGREWELRQLVALQQQLAEPQQPAQRHTQRPGMSM